MTEPGQQVWEVAHFSDWWQQSPTTFSSEPVDKYQDWHHKIPVYKLSNEYLGGWLDGRTDTLPVCDCVAVEMM